MRKYITTLFTIFLLSVSVTAFAGSNKITSFKGTLKEITLIAADNTEYNILASETPFIHASEFSLHVEAGPSGQVPYGDYKAIKYVFENDFEVAGYVELTNSGAANGKYYTTGGTGALTFTKNGAPTAYHYSYEGGNDWGWCITEVSGSNLVTKENVTFTLSETKGKSITLNIELRCLWFGPGGNYTSWTNFDEATYINTAEPDAFRLSGNTLTAPFIDTPEIEIN